MRPYIVAALGAVALAQDTSAPVARDGVTGEQYLARLPEKASTDLRGGVVVSTNALGDGVSVQVSFSGLPEEGGPFSYHIHEARVPEDGNCTATLAHLDPYKRGEDPVCDPSAPSTCQVGDLAGKHGKITSGTNYATSYTDDYVSTGPHNPGFVGGHSLVVHFANKTRISCANFELIPCANSTSSKKPSTSSGGASGKYPYPILNGTDTKPTGTGASSLPVTTPVYVAPTVPASAPVLPSTTADAAVTSASASASVSIPPSGGFGNGSAATAGAHNSSSAPIQQEGNTASGLSAITGLFVVALGFVGVMVV